MTAIDLPRAVWQISGGPASRSYAEVFLKHGVALIGPGDAGPWTPERDDDEFEGGFVRRFASEVAAGDVFLLRTRIATIAAVGLVASDYLHVNAFDDVNGWDLQHARRVRWCRLLEAHAFESAAFGANPPRCSRVWSKAVVDFAERFVNLSVANDGLVGSSTTRRSGNAIYVVLQGSELIGDSIQTRRLEIPGITVFRRVFVSGAPFFRN